MYSLINSKMFVFLILSLVLSLHSSLSLLKISRSNAYGLKPSSISSNYLLDSNRMVLFSTQTSSSSSSTSSFQPNTTTDIDNEKKLQEFRVLIQEILKLAINTGPKMGITRTIQLTQAVVKMIKEVVKTPDIYIDKATGLLSLPRLVRRLFEGLGATYIKLGQFIASSPTLFPPEYVLEFQSCLDNSPTIPFDEIKSIIQSELKKPISEVYSYVSPVPLASASIAQVHLAKLKNGTEVCIKVQKPGTDVTLIADLNFLTVISKIVEFINPSITRVSLSNIVSDIKDSMFDELNFIKESENLVNFRQFLGQRGIRDCVAPMPYLGLTTKRVLTMEYLKGVPLVDLEGIKQYTESNGVSPEQTLISALSTWAMSVTENDRFHADLHGGNLLVLEDGRVGFIDFGIVGRIPTRIWDSIKSMVQGLVNSDFKLVASSLVKMGAASAEVDINKFASEVESLFKRISQFQPELIVTNDQRTSSVSAQLSVDERETTELVLELVAIADKNGLKLPREFGFLLKQSLYFDRYQKLLAPGVDPLRDVRVRESFIAMANNNDFLSNAGSSSSSGQKKVAAGGKVVDTVIVDPKQKK